MLALLLAVACAPASPAEETGLPAAFTLTEQIIVTENPSSGEAPVLPSETPAVIPLVTPRGDALEASDPDTVSLASGGLQLVEFFRFT